MPMSVVSRLSSEAETQSLAKIIAGAIEPTTVLFFQGDLGVGKTFFVKSLVAAMGCDEPVLSPSFPIMHSYATRCGEFLHLDLYRLDGGCDFYALGLLDKIDAVTWAIEWPDKGAYDWLSPDVECVFSFGEDFRKVELIAHSLRGENLLQVVVEHGFINKEQG